MDLVTAEKDTSMEAACLLVAIGVDARLDGLLGDGVKVDMDRGYVTVNQRYETSLPGIFAAGDVIGPPWLAHVATFEAVQVVNGIFGISDPRKVREYPGCTYCLPQVASIGMTEQAVKEAGVEYVVGRFPFSASGKAVASNHADGFVKVLADARYGELLGAHVIGENATELIAEYALAMHAELTLEDIHGTIHAHPTMSEALGEAAGAALGQAIHI